MLIAHIALRVTPSDRFSIAIMEVVRDPNCPDENTLPIAILQTILEHDTMSGPVWKIKLPHRTRFWPHRPAKTGRHFKL